MFLFIINKFMSTNFNFSHSAEYDLNIKLIDEFIRLYGIECRLLLSKKQNIDPVVFGDWSSIKTNKTDVFDIHIYSESADNFERDSYQFTDFGFNISDTMAGYISIVEANQYNLTIEKFISSLILLPSNKFLEVTDVEYQVPGMNNLWAYSDRKSAYKLTLRTYEFKLHDHLDQSSAISTMEVESVDDIEETEKSYDILDGYFETLLKKEDDIHIESEVKDLNSVKDANAQSDNERVFKPIVNNDEDDPFGW